LHRRDAHSSGLARSPTGGACSSASRLSRFSTWPPPRSWRRSNPGAESIRTGIGLDVRQQGQALLSVFWTVAGLVSLWLGLCREVREPRLAGFALLILAAGKVFLYDLSELESVWRVFSFIVLGLLFLLAALAYQRMLREPVG
jgi:uncharacterized membrane protein